MVPYSGVLQCEGQDLVLAKPILDHLNNDRAVRDSLAIFQHITREHCHLFVPPFEAALAACSLNE